MIKKLSRNVLVVALSLYYSNEVFAQGGSSPMVEPPRHLRGPISASCKFWDWGCQNGIGRIKLLVIALLLLILVVFVVWFIKRRKRKKQTPLAEENKVVAIIKANPNLSYDDMKRQALEAGVPEAEFDEAWREVNSKSKNKVRWKMILPIAIASVAVAVFAIFILKGESSVGIPKALGECSKIDNDAECRADNDCDSVWTIDAGFSGRQDSFIRCEKSSGISDLCRETGGEWYKANCNCYLINEQTSEEGRVDGSYSFHDGMGCITGRERCLAQGREWEPWLIVQGEYIIDTNPIRNYSCLYSADDKFKDQYKKDLESITDSPDSLTKEEQLEIVSKNPRNILLIDDPDEEVLIFMATKYSYVFASIEELPETVQLAVIESNSQNFQYINNPTEKVIEMALADNSDLIAFVGKWEGYSEDDTEEAQLKWIEEINPRSFEYFYEPSQKVIIAAVIKQQSNFSFIDDPAEEVQLAAIENHPPSIRYIKNPTEAAQIMAVTAKSQLIMDIVDPSQKAIDVALNAPYYSKDLKKRLEDKGIVIESLRILSDDKFGQTLEGDQLKIWDFLNSEENMTWFEIADATGIDREFVKKTLEDFHAWRKLVKGRKILPQSPPNSGGYAAYRKLNDYEKERQPDVIQ